MEDLNANQRSGQHAGASERARPSGEADPTSLFTIFTALIGGRWRIARWTIIGGALASVYATMRPITYTASGSFFPQRNEGTAGGLATLAGRIGLSIGGNESQSPEFYRALVTSDLLLRSIAADTFVVQEPGVSRQALLDLLRIRDEDPGRRLEKGVERLREKLDVSVNNATGVVQVAIATEWPSLSAGIVEDLIDGVHGFNRKTRQGEAAAEREFIESRLRVVEEELRAAEDSLKAFLVANRQFEGAPELQLQYDRLQREVSSRQQVLTSLTQSYDEARIREVRNTPVITVVEEPRDPALPDARRRLLFGLLGTVLGFCLGAALSLASDVMRQHVERADPDAERLRVAVQNLRGDLGAPVRWPVRLLRG